jgi:hypothetical protein
MGRVGSKPTSGYFKSRRKVPTWVYFEAKLQGKIDDVCEELHLGQGKYVEWVIDEVLADPRLQAIVEERIKGRNMLKVYRELSTEHRERDRTEDIEKQYSLRVSSQRCQYCQLMVPDFKLHLKTCKWYSISRSLELDKHGEIKHAR